MTRDELIAKMHELCARTSAMDWVEATDGTPLELAEKCQNPDWLIYGLGSMRPDLIAGFARRCADRALLVREPSPNDIWWVAWAYAAAHAASLAVEAGSDSEHVTCRVSVAAEAARSVGESAAAWEAERKEQLDDLRAIAREVL